VKLKTVTLHLIAITVTVLVATTFTTPSTLIYTSYTVVPKSIGELARESDLIVVAKVIEILPSKLDTSDPKMIRIWTDIRLQVERYIKAPSNSSTVEVRLAGGTANGVTHIVSGGVELEAGQRVLLFLKKEPNTIWGDHFFVHGFVQGRYLLDDGSALNEDPAKGTSEKALIAEIQKALSH